MQTTDLGDAAQKAVNTSRSFVSKQLDERTTQLGQQITSTADDLRKIGDQLRQSGTIGGAASLADSGADAIERVGRYFIDSDGDALLADLENVARRQPWAVASAALVTGFAASRVLKAASARRYRTTYGSTPGSSYGSGSGSSYATGSGTTGSGRTYREPDDYGEGVDGATYAP